MHWCFGLCSKPDMRFQVIVRNVIVLAHDVVVYYDVGAELRTIIMMCML
jgi:hypothetical protein